MIADLFSLHGRVSRVGWWLRTGLIVPLIAGMGLIPLVFSAGELNGLSEQQRDALVNAIASLELGSVGALSTPAFARSFYIFLLFFAVSQWINIAATVRRYHDRNKTGLWALVSFLPVIGPFWVLLECGFMSAVDADNQFDRPSTPGEQGGGMKSLAERIEREAIAHKASHASGSGGFGGEVSQQAPAERPSVKPVVSRGQDGPRKSFGRKPALGR